MITKSQRNSLTMPNKEMKQPLIIYSLLLIRRQGKKVSRLINQSRLRGLMGSLQIHQSPNQTKIQKKRKKEGNIAEFAKLNPSQQAIDAMMLSQNL